MSNSDIIKSLEVVLANTYALYLKTQNYHWNVEGEHFYSLHKMFEQQYEQLAEKIDETAERIRILGAKAPGTFKVFSSLSMFKNANPENDWKEMVKDLLEDHKSMCLSIQKFIKDCEDEHDYTSNDILTERLALHQKMCWMLEATIL